MDPWTTLRYHAAAGWLCKGTFTAQPKDKFTLLQQNYPRNTVYAGVQRRSTSPRDERELSPREPAAEPASHCAGDTAAQHHHHSHETAADCAPETRPNWRSAVLTRQDM